MQNHWADASGGEAATGGQPKIICKITGQMPAGEKLPPVDNKRTQARPAGGETWPVTGRKSAKRQAATKGAADRGGGRKGEQEAYSAANSITLHPVRRRHRAWRSLPTSTMGGSHLAHS
eukprot:9504182-Pyramimonas_sp.AAC.10